MISTPMNAPWLTTLAPALSDFSSDWMVATGMANPMFWALVPSGSVPATAVFMPMTSAVRVEQRSARVPGVDGGVGLDHVVEGLGGRRWSRR